MFVGLASSTGLLAGCAGSPTATPTALASTCRTLSAILSDGPDPQADPVGYAEAQIVPLGQLHSSDATLERDIEGLDHAYERALYGDGTPAAKAAVAKAEAKVNAVCPDAAP